MTEKGPAPENPELVEVSATELNPEQIATLSVDYQDDVAVIKMRDGVVIPAKIAVTTEMGDVVAVYTAGPATEEKGPELSTRQTKLQADFADNVGFYTGVEHFGGFVTNAHLLDCPEGTR